VQDDVWAQALGRLTAGHPDALPSLRRTVGALQAAGGLPFEVIAGTPAGRYGARLTFRAGADTRALARAAGLAGHPWGTPDWVGVRTSPDGATRCKGYHRRPPRLGITTVHRGLPPGADPVMAARDGDALEVYAMWPGERSWSSFVTQCLAPLGLIDVPAFAPLPQAAARGFAASARHDGDVLTAVTLYAFPPSLPGDDEAVLASWSAGMAHDERAHLAQSVAAAQSLAEQPGRLVGLLAWTFDRQGAAGRAMSLRVAVPG
jgi:hypothetical protein